MIYWHKVLGELRSMPLALPGSQNLFNQLQKALSAKIGTCISLKKGAHQTLKGFQWILDDIATRPTRIVVLIPLLCTAEGHHDASRIGAGGVWFPSPNLNPHNGFDSRPFIWRLEWPQFITEQLVSSTNPNGTISNSNLKLASDLIQLEALTQSFDIYERTVLSKTDNLATLYWQRKESATTNKVPAYLLCSRCMNILTSSNATLLTATFASLTFTDQKNGGRGKDIDLGISGDPFLCCVKACACGVDHLRAHNTPATTPLTTAYIN